MGHGGELEKGPIIIFDLETTGLDPEKNEIIEIGALRVESNEIKSVFNMLIKPENKLPDEIINITGITDEMLQDAGGIKDVLQSFLDFAGPSPVMAHNTDFDVPFIKAKAKAHLGKDFRNHSWCTLQLSRILLPNLENHKLHTIAHYFNIPIYARHRAIGDVEATFQVWQKFLQKLKERNITSRSDLDKFIAENLKQTPF